MLVAVSDPTARGRGALSAADGGGGDPAKLAPLLKHLEASRAAHAAAAGCEVCSK